nr:FliH/SctL family protein [Legionella micdadei]
MQQAASHVQKKQQELAHWLDLLQHPAKLLDNELNQEIVQTILWICEVCIGVELSIHPEKLLTLIDVIKPELPLLQGKKQLLLNPEDADYLMNELKPSGDSELIQFIIPDPSLARGDFYLKSDFSDLDGRVKTRLKNLLKSYLQNDNHDDMDSE